MKKDIEEEIENLFKKKKFEEIIELLEKNRSNIGDFLYNMYLGDVYFDLGDFEKSLEIYEKIINKRSIEDRYTIIVRYSSCLKNLNRFDEAIVYLDLLIKKFPDDIDLYFNKGNIFLRCENYNDAIVNFNIAYTNGDRSSDLLNNLGLSYMRNGDNLNALRYFTEGVSLFEYDAQIIENIAIVLNNMGYEEESKAFINKMVQKNKNDDKTY